MPRKRPTFRQTCRLPPVGESFSLPSRDIPQLDRPIVAGGRELLVIVAVERHALDSLGVSLKGADFLCGGSVPQLDRPIVAGGFILFAAGNNSTLVLIVELPPEGGIPRAFLFAL